MLCTEKNKIGESFLAKLSLTENFVRKPNKGNRCVRATRSCLSSGCAEKIRPGCVDSIDRTDALLFAGDLLYYICYTIYNIKIVENSIETERGERYEAVSGKTEPAF